MASTRQIKSRIRSVKSNKQITKAMELIAASKLRKSQEAANNSREYAAMALDILASLAKTSDVAKNELFTVRDVKTRLIIVISSDRGLAGAYNSNVFKVLAKQLKDDQTNRVATKVIAIGKKAGHFASKVENVDLIGAYEAKEVTTQNDIRGIITTALTDFKDGSIDAVDVVATEFVNSFTQTAYQFALLPAGKELLEDTSTDQNREMTFEPSVEYVLEYAVIRLIETQLFQALLDSTASEHAMRRAAMKNASDNAADIVDDLTLEMNKVRQAAITQELSEISSGVEAMK